MGNTILLISFITKFVTLYDLYFIFFSDVIFTLGIYIFLKRNHNAKLKNAFFISCVKIPISLLSIFEKRDLFINSILELLLCYFLFIGFAETQKNIKLIKVSYIALILSVIQIIGINIIGWFVFIPPQITSRVTWFLVWLGAVLTILSFALVKCSKKANAETLKNV